jgi:hypothetical protein
VSNGLTIEEMEGQHASLLPRREELLLVFAGATITGSIGCMPININLGVLGTLG